MTQRTLSTLHVPDWSELIDFGAGISICDSFDDPVGGPTVRFEDIISPQQLENILNPMPILTLAENDPVSPMSIHNDDILDTALLFFLVSFYLLSRRLVPAYIV